MKGDGWLAEASVAFKGVLNKRIIWYRGGGVSQNIDQVVRLYYANDPVLLTNSVAIE